MILLILHKLAIIAPTWIGPLLALASGGTDRAAEGGAPKLPSLVELLFGPESIAEHWVNVIYAFAVGIFLSLVCMRVYAKRQMIPGKLQNAVEMMVEGMYNFIESILGKEAKKYVPYLGSLFFYILLMNWIGMIPLGHSPSTSLNITASLAILTFLYAQWTGITRLGALGYLHHMAGSPRDVISWCMVPLLFPLHIIGELAKPFSLALRLFGNITGEDTLVAVFVGLGIAILAFSPVGVPLQLPFYFLGLLLSTIQALVFTLLSTIYILLMLPHEEHAH
ncbi:MAG: F0F1 ATP synthase subunit A [candidate division Zixibacteria bacterium]|nr:F0F1 ATP synthase subunit A [candidate division Zixibacteria bacterium]